MFENIFSVKKNSIRFALLCCGSVVLTSSWADRARADGSNLPVRVLLLSIDGMHALDVARYVKYNTASNLGLLLQRGVNYTTASCAKPADSFPGMLAIATGGSPISTGVYFDLSYDRSLWPPGVTSGPTGTVVAFNETVDFDPNALDGGGGLNPDLLPRDPARGGAVVYPHDYLRVNTIFEVIKAAGHRTAWSDKHLADEIIQGPSGQGVDDLYLLEINANNAFGVSTTKSLDATKEFDDMKVQGILNQINGLDHTGSDAVGVPTIFGMNFQAVSVAQRLKNNKNLTGGNATGTNAGPGGYLDGAGTPSQLLIQALDHTDASIGQMISALQSKGLLDTTYIIVTAKHGQAPIDPTKLVNVNPGIIPGLIDPSVVQVLLTSGDDAALLWLADQSKTADAVTALLGFQADASIADIWANDILKLHFPDPLLDPRTPDIIAIGNPGTIYATSGKIAEHGGFSDQDVNVPIIISNPHLAPQTVQRPVQTAQIAPTILQLLGLNPYLLQAVLIEKTTALPGFEPAFVSINPPVPTSLGFNGNAIVNLTNGQARFQVTAAGTQKYEVQASTNLTNWVSIATNHVLVVGSTTITDPQAGSFSNRFYRAVQTP
jgi:hypothetical protein